MMEYLIGAGAVLAGFAIFEIILHTISVLKIAANERKAIDEFCKKYNCSSDHK